MIYYEDCMTLPGWFEHNSLLILSRTYLHDVSSLRPRQHVLWDVGTLIYMYHKKLELDLSTGLSVGVLFRTRQNDSIIWHPPFWEYITWQFYYTITGDVCGGAWQSKSMDSPGQQFLDLLDQASWCHAGMAGSSVAAQVWHGMSQTLALGHCSGWLAWQGQLEPVSSGVPVLQVQEMWAACMVQMEVMQVVPLWSQGLSCSVAGVPLGTVLAALTLHSQRCLCMQRYVEPLLVHTR